VKLSRRGIGVSRLPVKPPPAPLPDFVEPMKAQLADSVRPGDWLYEIKFDGYRVSNELAVKIGKCHPFVWNDPARLKSADQRGNCRRFSRPVVSQLYDFGSQGCRFEPCRVQMDSVE
jgi:hypothetical protein